MHFAFFSPCVFDNVDSNQDIYCQVFRIVKSTNLWEEIFSISSVWHVGYWNLMRSVHLIQGPVVRKVDNAMTFLPIRRPY